MRLIDANKMTKVLKEMRENSYDGKVYIESCLYFISIQPTAYDMAKVVEELEENSVMRANSKTFYNDPQNGKYVDEVVLLNKAIEIVKAGAADDD